LLKKLHRLEDITDDSDFFANPVDPKWFTKKTMTANAMYAGLIASSVTVAAVYWWETTKGQTIFLCIGLFITAMSLISYLRIWYASKRSMVAFNKKLNKFSALFLGILANPGNFESPESSAHLSPFEQKTTFMTLKLLITMEYISYIGKIVFRRAKIDTKIQEKIGSGIRGYAYIGKYAVPKKMRSERKRIVTTINSLVRISKKFKKSLIDELVKTVGLMLTQIEKGDEKST
jgi:hypothetical protein